MNPTLDAGDIVRIDFDPVMGTEQAGRRPALVVSSSAFHEVSWRAVVCPITSSTRPWPAKLALPASCRTRGMVLVDQVRGIDREARLLRSIEKCPETFVTSVPGHIARLLEIQFP